MRVLSRISAIVTGAIGVAFLVGVAVVLIAPTEPDDASKIGPAIFLVFMALTMFAVAAMIWWTASLTSGMPKPTGFRASMSSANEAMARGSHLMSASAGYSQLAGRLAVEGLEGTAVISEAETTGVFVNMEPLIALSLLVDVEGRPRYPAALEIPLSPLDLARAQPGAVVSVKVSPTDPTALVIDWTRRPAAA